MGRQAFESVVEAIRERGPITFSEYMERALYGPGGYYEHPPVGPAGDFVTSPHVHPVFGELLAEAISDLWGSIDGREPLHLVEAGAGDGTLLHQLLSGLSGRPLEVTAVERSSGAREVLAAIDGVSVSETVPTFGPAVILCHELLDNLPFRRIRGTDQGSREVRIGLDDGRLVEVLVPIDADVVELGGPPPTESLAPGDEVISPTGAVDFLIGALTSTDGAPRAALVIDYGSDEGAAGTVHGYRGHRVVEDVLADPGKTDVTAGVDFGILLRASLAAGCYASPSVSQRDALMALGFQDWLHSALERQADLLNTGRGADAVRLWGGRSRASMLIDPAGLGRTRWFLASSIEVMAPRWMDRSEGP